MKTIGLRPCHTAGRLLRSPMNLTRLASLALPLLLAHCVDPYYGPNGPDPYANPYRQDMRDQGAQMNAMAFERGQQDGQSDAQQGLPPDYTRYPSRFDRNTTMAYRDGYNQRYNQMRGSQGQPGVNPGYGNNQPGALPPPPGTAQQQRDPVYNQGYDYGLRDRTNGRVADPSAFVGRYDPRYRSSFERGYYDAFNSSSNGTAPAYPGSGGNGWFQ